MSKERKWRIKKLISNIETLLKQIIRLVSRFPCAATAKLLIRCGADVNAMDSERNTPLHIIVGYSKSIRYFINIYISYAFTQRYADSNTILQISQRLLDFTFNYNGAHRSWSAYGHCE